MPATFQKIMDFTLPNINSAHTFLDYIIIITKGSLINHEKELDKVLARLDKENLAISLDKCEFAVTETTWLGYKINPDGIIPTKQKTKTIIKMDPPKNTKTTQIANGKYTLPTKVTPTYQKYQTNLDHYSYTKKK